MQEDATNRPRLRIGDLILDPGTREIQRGDEPIELPRLSFQLLLTLAESAPNVVSQDDLIERVWSGRVVSPETVTQRVKLLRQALGDDAQDPRYVGLVRGEGYRMLATVAPLAAGSSVMDPGAGGLLEELRRRRVPQAALVYAAVAWGITKIVSFLLDALPTFPAGSEALVAILFVVGFPVAMLVAWRFNVSRGGVQRTEALGAENRKTITLACVFLIGATGALFYLIYPRIVDQSAMAGTGNALRTPEIQPNSIAVLPFDNVSGEKDDDWITTGLGDELRSQLARTPGLRVAARTSSLALGADALDAQAVGSELGVRLLIEGSVQRQNDSLRIALTIIDSATGFARWSRTYDRRSRDLLAIQRQIARDVVESLASEFDVQNNIERKETGDVSAYELLLLGRHYEQQVRAQPETDVHLLTRAIELYREATTVDPDYGAAWGRLGAALLYFGKVDEAEPAILRALDLDPDLAEVQTTLGNLLWLRRKSGAGDAYQRAVELNPNDPDALQGYAWWLWHRPDNTAPLPYYREALALDPLSLTRYTDLGHFLGLTGQDGTVQIIDEIRTRFSGAQSHAALAHLLELTGAVDEAIVEATRAQELEPDNPVFGWQLAELYARIGDLETAATYEDSPSLQLLYRMHRYDELIDLAEVTLIEQPQDTDARYLLAFAYNATGQFQSALAALETGGMPDYALGDTRRVPDVAALADYIAALQTVGRGEEARRHAEWLLGFMQTTIDTGHSGWWPFAYKACALMFLQRRGEALDALERTVASPRLPFLTFLEESVCFRDLREDSRYVAVLEQIRSRQSMLRAKLAAGSATPAAAE